MIRIFIGTPANNEDLESQSVLEYSLRKHASEPLDITWMKASSDPASFWYADRKKKAGWNMSAWATPFSGFRWGIPAFCNFEGKAIYLDIDMIVMDDIAKLWHEEINGKAFCIAKDHKTFCTTLFDCAKAEKRLPPINQLKAQFGLYAHLKRRLDPSWIQPFGTGEWNCLDGENYASIRDPQIKIVHCTSIPTQPQLRYALARLAKTGGKHWSKDTPKPHWRKDILELFDEVLAEAIAAGYPPERYYTSETFGNYYR